MSFNKKENSILMKYGNLEFIEFKNLSKYKNIITHCFTTRRGGVSSGECSTLNLGFKRKDSKENVSKNYEILSDALKINCENMVFSNQVHDNKIKIVDKNDRGKGIIRDSDIIGYDALVTNQEEVTLVTFYADCVPVFLFDPEKKVIALAHSGWRGTVKEIAKETVKKMADSFGSDPAVIEAAIGPSIGVCCFEVDYEVYTEFIKHIPYSKEFCMTNGNGKWRIDLKSVIFATLNRSEILPDHICISDYCTKCNNDLFFSHRGDLGKTGSLAAVMQINPTKDN